MHVNKENVAYAPPFDPLPSRSLDHVSLSNLSYIQRLDTYVQSSPLRWSVIF